MAGGVGIDGEREERGNREEMMYYVTHHHTTKCQYMTSKQT